MLFNLIKKLIGRLSNEDKKKLGEFIKTLVGAAAAGAAQGAVKR